MQTLVHQLDGQSTHPCVTISAYKSDGNANMSAGAFVRSKYACTDTGLIHPIRIQPETLAASIGGTANAAPAGAISSNISARVAAGKRTLGLGARRVNLQAPATGQPAGYLASGTTSIPALQEAFYALAVKGATCTYQGVAYTVVSRTDEVVN